MEDQKQKNKYSVQVSIILIGILIATGLATRPENIFSREASKNGNTLSQVSSVSAVEEAVLPPEGVTLPVSWGDLGQKLVSVGAIDAERFKSLYEQRGQFTGEYETLLLGKSEGNLKITRENAGYVLNLLWALGLANKNPILDSGEMADPNYGGAGGFASTGGWTMAVGDPMDHYSRHKLIDLTPEEQALVDKVSRTIYRPCCGNSTHFPDCNHGMAMLGLLELMASQGVSEEEMYKVALAVNSYWFPDTYLTIAEYMKNRGVSWDKVSPKEMLGANYSSASGFRKIASQVRLPESQGGGSGCGVESGQPVVSPIKQSGCGVDAGQAIEVPKKQSGCGV